jgi:hypothetical protein
MEGLDQGHLHPLLEHPETNISWPEIESGSPASQIAIRTAYAVAIRNQYMAAPVHGTHTFCKERKLKCRITGINIQLLLPE